MAYILLIVSLGVILVAAEIFTNGVEWLGVRLNLSEGAVGSILAAVGTAMPESLIPLIAFISGKGIEQQHIGIGAIIGAPFMLSTLAFFISGLVVVLEAKKRLDFPYLRVDERVIRRDITFFFVGYGLGLGAAFMTNPAFKYLIAAFLIGWYCLYVWLTLRSGRGAGHSSDLRPLYFSASKKTPRLMLIAFQVLVAITLLIVGANLFVKEVPAHIHHAAVNLYKGNPFHLRMTKHLSGSATIPPADNQYMTGIGMGVQRHMGQHLMINEFIADGQLYHAVKDQHASELLCIKNSNLLIRCHLAV
jgi:Ca2+/Na+ antiporter